MVGENGKGVVVAPLPNPLKTKDLHGRGPRVVVTR
jgi:hypothetical protein